MPPERAARTSPTRKEHSRKELPRKDAQEKNTQEKNPRKEHPRKDHPHPSPAYICSVLLHPPSRLKSDPPPYPPLPPTEAPFRPILFLPLRSVPRPRPIPFRAHQVPQPALVHYRALPPPSLPLTSNATIGTLAFGLAETLFICFPFEITSANFRIIDR